MQITHEEAVAALHVLVAVAQADGKLEPAEREALEAAIGEAGLDEIVSVEDLFGDRFDLAPQLALLARPEAREATFRSAYSLAYADGECSAEERALLSRLREGLAIPEAHEQELRTLFDHLAADHEHEPVYVERIDDPEKRGEAVRAATLKCAIITAVLGAFPFPGFAVLTDLAALYLQVELVRDIAVMHGQQIDKTRARALLAAVGLGTTARLAVSNLAKLLPGWGSVIGATTSFASSYAAGVAFDRHFEAGLDHEALARVFAEAHEDGKREYHANKDDIAARSEKAKVELAALAEQRKSGALRDAELHERVRKI